MATTTTSAQQRPPFDVVILDYKMPKMDGLQTAKEILKVNPSQRIIFASAYVLDTLIHSVKELNRVVELIQKPFEISILIDTIEDKEASDGLKRLMVTIRGIEDVDNLTSNQVQELFDGLRKIQKFREF